MGPGGVQKRPPPAHTAHTPNLLPSPLQSRIELELGRTKAPESPSMCRNQAADLGEGQGAEGHRQREEEQRQQEQARQHQSLMSISKSLLLLSWLIP